jgi:plastocyanin
MADVKISDLVSANVVNKNDLFLLVQDDSSKNVSAETLFSSITDPTLSGNIFFGGPVQSLSGVGTVSITTTRTDLYGGTSAATSAIANGSVLPSTIYLYTDGKSASGRGLQFQDGTPFFKTIYVQHINGKIHLSLGANAFGALNHEPSSWAGTTGLRPFDAGLYFVKGSVYTFDVSHPTNAGNIIGLSTSIDGTNTLGLEYTPGVVRTGNPGNTGATFEFTPANVSIDQGGKSYLDIPRGVDGQLKVINLVSTNGGQFVISSNIQNNLAIELRKAGDSAFLMYSGNAWILVGSNPGLQTSFSGTSDDIPEGQKLYFTNARARAAISVPDNTLIYNATTGSIRANVLALSNINLGNIIPNSDSIPEGAVNLYYSNARVHANLRLASIDALADVDTVTIAPQTGYALVWNGTRWIPNVISATTFSGTIDSANTAASANVANTVLSLSNFTTANLIESSSNLYYSNDRVFANLLLANINVLADVDTVTVAPTYGDALSWNGNTWVPSAVNATNALTSNLANLVSSLSNFTTANLTEGTNLYYTNARVYANLSLANLNVFADVNANNPGVGQVLYWNGSFWEANSVNIPATEYANIANTVISVVQSSITANVANTVLSLNNFTTANLTEGTNLYYTNARVYSAITGNLSLKANVLDLTTANVIESAGNLYYTNARVNAQVQSNLALKANVVDLTTANVIESAGNLYYTNARVNAQVAPNLVLKANVTDLTTANVAESFATLTDRTYGVTASGSSAYVFTGYSSGNNIAITAEAGTVLTFNVNASGHPFWIKTVATTGTGSAVTTGVTNNGAQIGTVVWDTAGIAPGTYYYICQFHGSMVGTITILERPQYLYYTNARVFSNLTLASINVLADVDTLTTPPSSGQALGWNGTAWIPTTVSASNANTATVANTVLSIGNFTTSNLAEGTNLYYTNARVNAQVESNLRLKANVVDLTTANVVELNNLYYTNTRVDSHVNPKLTTANVAELNNLYYTNTRVDSHVNPKLTTANVVELNNLYYTNARVNAQVESNLSLKANVVDLTTANVIESASNLYYTNDRVYANVTDRFASINTNLVPDTDEAHDLGAPDKKWKDLYLSGFSITLGSTRITSGAGGALSVQALASNSNVTTKSITSNIWNNIYTANVLETNSNLYYTNARVRSTLSNGTGVYYDKVTGAISIGQNVDTTSNVTFAGLNVFGHTNFYGNVTTYSSNNLSISDNMIYLNASSDSSNPDLGFAGNYNDGTYRHAGFFRDASDAGTWKVYDSYALEPDANIFIDTDHASFRLANIAATTVRSNLIGNVTGFVSTISNFSTTNLVEGDQLYYTNARVDSHVDPKLTTANVVELNNLYYSNDRVESYVNPKLTTANVIESSNNLYYTNARVESYVNPKLTTANVIESSNNLYYTNARVNAQVESNLALKANIVDLTTANVAELNNLYYSNARVLSNVAQMSINVFADVDISGIGNNGILIWNGTSFVAGAATTATEANFANVAGTANVALVANFANVAETANVALVANFANVAETANVANTVLSINNFTTSNLAEGTNLYYTNARVYSNVIASLPTYTGNVGAGNVTIGSGTGGSIIGANLISAVNISATNWQGLYSANVIESQSALYYSNARVLSNVAQMSINVFADVDITGIGNTGVLIWNGTSFVAGSIPPATSANFANVAETANVALVANFAGTANVALVANFANVADTANVALVANFANVASTANVANTVLSISNFTTSNLAEGTNLYYTNARVNAQVAPNLVLKANVTDLTTANVIESLSTLTDRTYGVTASGSSAYVFTGYSSGNNIAITVQVGTVLVFNVNASGHPFWIKTAPVTGTGSAVTTGVSNNGAAIDTVVWDTSSIAPGTYYYICQIHGAMVGTITVVERPHYLYYTNARVNAQVESNLRLKANVVDLTTANVVELNNLYYSNARVLSNVAQMSINVFADVDISNIQPNDTLVWDGTKFIKANAGQSTAIVANVTTTGNVEITRFSTATYSTAKYVYTAKGTSAGYTNKYNSGELLVLHDDTSSFITQYAMISNDNNLDLLSFEAGINNGNVIIYGNVSDPAIQVTVKLTGVTYTEK